jgi:hypothetical protein
MNGGGGIPWSYRRSALILSGHLKRGHAWSLQNRPCTKAVRDEIVLLCRLLRKQVCFCAPASRTAFEYVPVVKQALGIAMTAALSPSNFPQSSTGRLEVSSVLARS